MRTEYERTQQNPKSRVINYRGMTTTALRARGFKDPDAHGEVLRRLYVWLLHLERYGRMMARRSR